ncbi:hypothetical protein [Tsuneonella sp. SYSU-LHT278]
MRAMWEGLDTVEITVRYVQPVNFILFQTPPITLRETERVFTQLKQE